MAIDFDPQDYYLNYLQQHRVKRSESARDRVDKLLRDCNWEQPQSPQEWNSLTVIALVAAQAADLPLTQGLYAEIAFDAAQAGAELENAHPLCIAHLAIFDALVGNYGEGAEIAFNTFIDLIQSVYEEPPMPPGLVFVPPLTKTHLTRSVSELLQELVNLEDGRKQALLLLSEALCRSQIALDNPTGIRLLHLLETTMPTLVYPKLKLGIYSVGNRELEGLIYLHQAYDIAPENFAVTQALHLAYRDLERLDLASYWQEIGRDYRDPDRHQTHWNWTQLPIDSPYTLVDYEGIALAIEPTLQSATTRALLAEGDWFERELEFWRDYLQSGMMVIDVGAGVGIYALNAARQVGERGKVYAIEPYSKAAACLAATCQSENLKNLYPARLACGEKSGQINLALQATSELNYQIDLQTASDRDLEVELVDCITLDRFVEQQGLDRLEAIKISVSGRELNVLQGADRVLREFAPMVIYTNYTGAGINLAVAEYLSDRGYDLFRYQPYIKELIPLKNSEDFNDVMKVIAIPQ